MKKKLETQLPFLSTHLIWEQILPRLPVKSLIRFKTVCKRWHSTISTHEFQKAHLRFSSYCNQALILRNTCDYKDSYGNILSFDECLNVKELVTLEYKYPSLYLSNVPRSSNVIGSCNGLVCLYDKFGSFLLWNPALNQCRNVISPYSHYRMPPLSRNLFTAWGKHCGTRRVRDCNEIIGVGFGYVSSIDDYVIGCLWTCCKELCHVCILSLRAERWKTITSLDLDYYFQVGRKIGHVIDHTMYWPPVIKKNPENHMVALDLVGEQLKKIPLIDFGVSYEDVKVFPMKGCLSLCCMNYVDNDHNSHVYDVWMLKQLDDLNSWAKIISLRGGVGGFLFYLFETGECLVARGTNQVMLHCPSQVAPEQYEEGNLIWQGFEEETYFQNFVGEAWSYVESLISPFGTPKMIPRQENESNKRHKSS